MDSHSAGGFCHPFVVIPQAIRETLGLRLGEKLRGIRYGERVELIPGKKIRALPMRRCGRKTKTSRIVLASSIFPDNSPDRCVLEQILISRCRLGERVRYHGGDARIDHPILRRWQEEGRLVPICPEVAGGLTTPRPAAEIATTPEGRRVLTVAGEDVTSALERGAEAAAEACAANGIRIAILKDASPSCGSHSVYDGSFSDRRVEGQGMTAAYLIAAGIKVFSESEIEAAAHYVAALESRQV